MVAADLACLLQRFALRQSFSADAGGGGRASNARLAPGLVQLGRHLLASASGDALTPLETALTQLSATAPIADGKVTAARCHARVIADRGLMLLRMQRLCSPSVDDLT